MKEFDIIRNYFMPLAEKAPESLGLQDDAAFFAHVTEGLVISKDTLVAGVHFFPDDAPESIAMKALGVNLSDIAAKGALPFRYFLSLALPGEITEDWIKRFSYGLASVQNEEQVFLAGGDTVAITGPLVISITMLAKPYGKHMVQRNTASTGDTIYVSGPVGDAVAGLSLKQGASEFSGLSSWEKDYFISCYHHPGSTTHLVPLIAQYASASMDISDGLITDLNKMCEASGTSVCIDLDTIPVSASLDKMVRENPELFARLVDGGDDYEILFCVPKDKKEACNQFLIENGIQGFAIGEMRSKDQKPEFLSPSGTRKLPNRLHGYEHFI